MKKEDIPQETIDAIWDECEMEDVELLDNRVAIRSVQCPWGYIFIHTHIAPDGQQLDLEKTGSVLDRKTEDSLRYLVAKGKAEGYV
jgi:hypothetical protein